MRQFGPAYGAEPPAFARADYLRLAPLNEEDDYA
jgi:hypothetical protein